MCSAVIASVAQNSDKKPWRRCYEFQGTMPTARIGIAVLSRTLNVLKYADAEMPVGDKCDKNLAWVQVSDVAGSSSADVSNIQSELS